MLKQGKLLLVPSHDKMREHLSIGTVVTEEMLDWHVDFCSDWETLYEIVLKQLYYLPGEFDTILSMGVNENSFHVPEIVRINIRLNSLDLLNFDQFNTIPEWFGFSKLSELRGQGGVIRWSEIEDLVEKFFREKLQEKANSLIDSAQSRMTEINADIKYGQAVLNNLLK